MTALSAYDRLEAAGLWRSAPEEQRREVIVSVGEATLTLSDGNDSPLTHWSIPAIARANPGQTPAVFHPDGDPGETLELSANESEMIAAIEKLRVAVEKSRPHPGRLRLIGFVATLALVVLLGVFWLPGALLDHTLSVVPEVKRQEIGQSILSRIERVSGKPCEKPDTAGALSRLAARLPGPDTAPQLVVLRGGPETTQILPGNVMLLNKTLFEDHEEPDVVAGFIVAQHLAAQIDDPLRQLLTEAGLLATVQLLTTGALPQSTLDSYAETLVTLAPKRLDNQTLLAGFQAWSVRITPYAYALDVTGETTLPLIEADPFAARAPTPLISDADWLRLQAICEG